MLRSIKKYSQEESVKIVGVGLLGKGGKKSSRHDEVLQNTEWFRDGRSGTSIHHFLQSKNKVHCK